MDLECSSLSDSTGICVESVSLFVVLPFESLLTRDFFMPEIMLCCSEKSSTIVD